jgi:hypothetical protein
MPYFFELNDFEKKRVYNDDRLALGSHPVHYYNIFESLTKFLVLKSMINAITNASENIMRDCPKPPKLTPNFLQKIRQ